MTFRVKLFLPIFFTLCLLAACGSRNSVNPKLSGEMPPRILWAWERPEDLRFLDPQKFGVAFLAQTLILTGDDIIFKPRRQPLELPENTYVIAVTRIETLKDAAKRPTLSAEQRRKVVEFVKKTTARPNIKAIQTDFDVVVSERAFYRDLATDLRREIPAGTRYSITSLASWCVGDTWFNDFPVDEAVPMAFEMGADSQRIRDFLVKGNDWNEPMCRGSYGFSVDDPIPDLTLKPDRRVWYFKSSAWTRADLEKLK